MKNFEEWLKSLKHTRTGAFLWPVANFLSFALRRFFAERLNNSVASLTYSTLLALVPLLVIAFAILSSFPAFDAIKEQMRDLFFEAVVPEAGDAISGYLASFTENASNLTAAGIVALAVTAVLLLSTIEDTLNRVWQVDRPRPVMVRFLIFWAALTLGPMLIAASFALTSDVLAYAGSSDLLALGASPGSPGLASALFSQLLSVLISVVGFTALFVLVPARRVRIRHAVIGATFAALAFEVLSWGFNTFLTSGSSYETIYGAVAAVPVFLVWVYTSWMVIILGAVLAAAFPDWWQARSITLDLELGPVGRMEIALEILARFHDHAQSGGAMDEDVAFASVPFQDREPILATLAAAGYVVETETGAQALSRDLHTTTLRDLVEDMGLLLGYAPGDKGALPDEKTQAFILDVDVLHRALGRLREAEDSILNTPLAALMRGIPKSEASGSVAKLPHRSGA